MKIRYTMALAIAIALKLGVFATRGLTVEVTRDGLCCDRT
jgi:hypothetical protein